MFCYPRLFTYIVPYTRINISLLTHLLTYSLAYLLTYSHSYLLSYLLTHLFTYFLTYLLTYLLTFLLTHFLTYLLTYLLTHLLTYLLTYLPGYELPEWGAPAVGHQLHLAAVGGVGDGGLGSLHTGRWSSTQLFFFLFLLKILTQNRETF